MQIADIYLKIVGFSRQSPTQATFKAWWDSLEGAAISCFEVPVGNLWNTHGKREKVAAAERDVPIRASCTSSPATVLFFLSKTKRDNFHVIKLLDLSHG